MSAKQDRQGARTTEDLERKYGFGRRFAEIFGIATDARTTAEKAEKAVTDLDNDLTQEEIFNRLTDNGKYKGVYRDEDGEIYINASYIKSGHLLADLIKGGVLSSLDGTITIELNGGTAPVFNSEISTNGLSIRGDAAGSSEIVGIRALKGTVPHLPDGYYVDAVIRSITGNVIGRFTESFSTESAIGAAAEIFSQDGKSRVRIDTYDDAALISFYHNDKPKIQITASDSTCGFTMMQDGNTVGSFFVGEDGKSHFFADKINGLTVSWKSNGDGTYTLVGS